MSGYGFFQPAVMGMKTQSHALNTIGINIANVNTGGYKRTDTQFETMLSRSLFEQSDLGGVKPKDFQRIDSQGVVSGSVRALDVAIVGDGFFQVSADLTQSGQPLYTRDGSFELATVAGETSSVTADDGSTISIANGYLVDKNGYFLLGWAPDASGNFSNSGAVAPLRVDQYAFINQSRGTSTASLNLNLPANKPPGFDPTLAETFNMDIVDSGGKARSIQLSFHKTNTTNQWQIVPTADNATTLSLSGTAFSVATGVGTTNSTLFTDAGTNDTIQIVNTVTGSGVPDSFAGLRPGDTITVAGSTSNNNTYTISAISTDGSTATLTTASPNLTNETDAAALTISSTQVAATPMVFKSDGALSSPTSYTVDVTWSDGTTNSIVLDVSDIIQLAGDFTPFGYTQNGLAAASMSGFEFDGAGHIVGSFEDGTQRQIYKLPLAIFANPNGLEMRNGQVFLETPDSGTPTTIAIDATDQAALNPYAVELSNVDITTEFSRMIMVQSAYNSSATVFRTLDEMTTTARDLKA